MRCDEAQTALATSAGEGVTAELGAHLDGCPACRTEAAALRRLVGALSALGAHERAAAAAGETDAAVDLLPAVRAAWAQRQAARTARRRWRRWSAGLAGVAVTAALVLALVQLRAPVRPAAFDPTDDVDPTALLDDLDAAALTRVAAALNEGA